MKSIKKELTVATCTLLSQHSANVHALENAWELDSSYLLYSEADDRVTVNKFSVQAGGDVSERDRVSITAVLDTMSGATPTGAVKQSTPSFTGASGGGGGGGARPGNASALAKFNDTRAGMALSWAHSYDNNWAVNYGGAVSIENDYESFNGSIIIDKETESKDYRFTLGVAVTADTIFRVGTDQTPEPLTRISAKKFLGTGEKNTTDIIAGVTHVINRRTVVQLNLAYTISNGYLTDPYKVFSVVDENTDKAFDSFYEGRPANRRRSSITAHLNHQTYPANNVIHVTYRYYNDDWDVNSHTLILGQRFKFNTTYFEPKIRLYKQTKAFFYQNEFFADVENNPNAPNIPNTFPQYLSADYRLDAISSVTPEIQFGSEIGTDDHLRARIGYMYQKFEKSEFDTNRAIIFQIAYNKRF
ncbi:MAG: DUF3570 domain-containing protein [Gammaproteobacteria bacterium]|nr:MAG: DUF3570 domain-containing protein [Gammaproteobacteria bacterium]